MSIGNLKDSGNQGNNLPYQWRVLQGLQAILDEVAQPLTCVEDSVTICNENIAGGVTLEVNLDPDNDSVGIYGYTNPANPATFTGIKVDANGELQVDVLTMPATFAEDTAHTSGNTGAFVLGVRNDSNTAMTSANGDYSPVAVNANGAVAINDGGNSITVDTTQLPTTLGEKASTDSVSVTLSNDELGIARTTGIIRPTGATAIGNVNTVPTSGRFFSVSVANVGAANGSLLGVANSIKPGEVLNFSADAINNYFTTFAYDATGTEFIIIFVY
jgi:hypothetical protein